MVLLARAMFFIIDAYLSKNQLSSFMYFLSLQSEIKTDSEVSRVPVWFFFLHHLADCTKFSLILTDYEPRSRDINDEEKYTLYELSFFPVEKTTVKYECIDRTQAYNQVRRDEFLGIEIPEEDNLCNDILDIVKGFETKPEEYNTEESMSMIQRENAKAMFILSSSMETT